MEYNKATVENGKIVVKETKVINQSLLTSDCWLIQIEGRKACDICEYKNTDECGGGDILRRSK